MILSALRRRLGEFYLGKYRNNISEQPLNAEVHYNFACNAHKYGFNNLANAELKNAEYLGFCSDKVASLRKKITDSLTDLAELDVNQYQRFKILQAHLSNLLNAGDSMLDIGGGHGILTQFVPENRYFLVEPSVNGVSGLKLPFPDSSFDAVVTCHVLEHIPVEQRNTFIDELVRVSKRYVLIFNPFKDNKLDEMERLKLILDITGAPWAKEHMDCGLPVIDDVTTYLSTKGLSHNIKGYGDVYASVATVLMTHFSSKSKRKDIVKINQHLNKQYDQLTCSKYPTNIMVEIRVD